MRGCGRSARPVRREGERKPLSLPLSDLLPLPAVVDAFEDSQLDLSFLQFRAFLHSLKLKREPKRVSAAVLPNPAQRARLQRLAYRSVYANELLERSIADRVRVFGNV